MDAPREIERELDERIPPTVPSGASWSLLHPDAPPASATGEAPPCFRDLNLDQVVARITRGVWAAYDLAELYHAAPVDRETIEFRQAVVRDVEREGVRRELAAFCGRLRTVRESLALAESSPYPLEARRFVLAAAETYVAGVRDLDTLLSTSDLHSAAMCRLRIRVTEYGGQGDFCAFAHDVESVASALGTLAYAVHLDGLHVTVLPCADEPEYASEVTRLFARFQQDRAGVSPAPPFDGGRLNHVEARILDGVARLFPAPFAALETFADRHREFVDARVVDLERELAYYLAYLDAVAPLREAGYPLVLPRFSTERREMAIREGYDLALAWQLVERGARVVLNDAVLGEGERRLVVTGPNSGGKTTFARVVGQIHYWARLGLPVPARTVTCSVCDQVLTHFERVEDPRHGRGKLQDELVRMRQLLGRATPDSLLIINEMFSSTTTDDALFLGRRVMESLSELGALAVCVTFLDELATFDRATVSMVSAVDPSDPAIRTFRVERRPADGLAYALAVARKHRVTGDWLERRLPA